MSDELSLRTDLLDRLIVDRDGYPFGRVEDVEVAVADGELRLTELRTGSQALGLRLGGLPGRWLSAASARLRPPDSAGGPTTLDAKLIAEAGVKVVLTASFEELPHVAPLERWLGRHVVGRIPGADDAGE